MVETAAEVARLRQENVLLKEYAEKVTKEIQRYQRKGVIPVADVGRAEGLPVPDVGSLTPLLYAYEERLRDLEGVLDKSVSLSEQIQELVNENKELRQQLVHTRSSGEEKRPGAVPSDYLLLNQEHEEKEDFAQLYQLATEQNEVLLQQNEMMKSTLERMKEEQNAQGMQAAHDRRLTHEARQVAKSTEECASHLQQQRDAAEAKLREVVTEFVEHKRMFESAQREWELKTREWRMERKSMDEFRTTYEERWKQTVLDADEAAKENERTAKQAQESRMRALKQERLCYELEEKVRLGRKELDATKAEADNMIVLMEGFEKRLHEATALREETKAELQEHIDQTDALIAERDRHKMLEQCAREQLTKMEARAQDTSEQLSRTLEDKTEGVRRHLTRKVAQLEEEIRAHGQMLSDEKVKHEVGEKQKAHENEQWARKVKLLETENKALERSAEQMHDRALQLEEAKHNLELEYARIKSEATDVSTTLSAKLRSAEESAVESQQALALVKQQLQEKVLACEQSQRASHAVRQRFDQLWSEHQAEKNVRAESEDHWRTRHAEEIATFRREWELEIQRCREAEEEAVELLRVQEDMWAQKDEEQLRGHDSLQDQIERLKRQNMELRLSQIVN